MRKPRVLLHTCYVRSFPVNLWFGTSSRFHTGALYPQQPPGAPSAYGAGESATAHPGAGPPRCQRMRAARMNRKKLAPFATEKYFRVSFSFGRISPAHSAAPMRRIRPGSKAPLRRQCWRAGDPPREATWSSVCAQQGEPSPARPGPGPPRCRCISDLQASCAGPLRSVARSPLRKRVLAPA